MLYVSSHYSVLFKEKFMFSTAEIFLFLLNTLDLPSVESLDVKPADRKS